MRNWNGSYQNAQYQPWWMRLIRSISWFSFRYWWFVWLLFLIALLFFYLKCFNTENKNCENTNKIEQIRQLDSLLNKCCNCDYTEIPEEAISFPADFLIITYQFDQEGGKDLDTRTRILRPIRTDEIGWCKPSFSSEFLFWSGDNTGYGVESCLVDLTKFRSNDRIEINCGAFWYNNRESGNMSIDIRAYKGGVMTNEGFQFVNNGGEETAFTSFTANISANSKECFSNEVIGIISYDKQTESLFFTPN